MSHIGEIERFAQRVARRNNAFVLRDVVLCILATSSSLTVVLSLLYVTRGHAVPAAVPGGMAAAAALAVLVLYLKKRIDRHAAVVLADRFFNLKDGITTARHLLQKAPDEAVTRMQWEWLAPRMRQCNPAAMVTPFPRKLSAVTGLGLMAASVLCLLPPSAAVLAEQEQAAATRKQVVESKEQLAELIDELEKEVIGEEERAHIAMEEFRQMVQAIRETGDRSEAARQFARVERKVREATRALDQQRDDETLKLAAKELQKSEDTDARKIGRKFEEKQLKEAAELLDKNSARKTDPKQMAKGAAAKKQSLEQVRKDLAKMRAATKRMAAAGKQRQAARQAQGQDSKQNDDANKADESQDDDLNQLAQHQERAGQPGKRQAKPLEDMLAELDDAAAAVEKDLQELEFDPDAEWNDEGRKSEEEMHRMKGMLGQHLKNMHGKNQAKIKLDALRDALAQASALGLQGQEGKNPGGKSPGTGSSFTERKERDDSQKNGQLAELKGQHGEGPALSSVEEAESGSGTSSRRGGAKQRDFARQAESFVERSDIPESLKLGVRNYFENLQSTTKER